MPSAEATEKFEGRTAVMRKSEWLSAEDLDGAGDVKVEIEGVFLHKNVPMDGGRKEPKLFSLKFKDKERQLIINASNRKTLFGLFGADTKQWPGKAITIYVKDGVKAVGGGTTKGIRIKE